LSHRTNLSVPRLVRCLTMSHIVWRYPICTILRERSSLPDMQVDYLRFYDLETYLWEDVQRRFHADGSIGAFDFFAIVIWKANRAKSKIAKRLLDKDRENRSELEPICRDLTATLYQAADAKERLRILRKDWGFYLPTASAILSVFWPDEFSVYDVRVREQLGGLKDLGNKTDFEKIWAGYLAYLEAVRSVSPTGLSLRECDRYLWGKSVAGQLTSDVSRGFT